MNCDAFWERILNLEKCRDAQEDTSPLDAECELHLQSCEDCRAQFRLWQALENSSPEPESEHMDQLTERILRDALTASPVKTPQRFPLLPHMRSARLTFLFGALTACLLAAAALFLQPFSATKAPPAPVADSEPPQQAAALHQAEERQNLNPPADWDAEEYEVEEEDGEVDSLTASLIQFAEIYDLGG